MQRFSQFLILALFIIFLAISLVSFSSDFIAVSIFCFLLFSIDLFLSFIFDSIEIECERKIYLYENGKRIEQKNNRFNNNQVAEIVTHIKIKTKIPIFTRFIQKLPEGIKLETNDSNLNNKISVGFFALNFPESYSNFIYSYKIIVKRGLYNLEPIKVKLYSPLFISSKEIEVDANLSFYAVPDETIDINLPIRSKKLLVYTGMIPSKKAGVGLNFYDVRQYYEGDKLNTINWKHSAKNESLYVNEFERESNTDVAIIVDCRNNPNTYSISDEIFEKAIEAAYCIAKSMLKAQNRVSFLQFGSFFNYIKAGYGKIQLEKITQALSRLKISDQEDFWELDNIPQSIIPSESLVFLITPFSEDDLAHIIRFHQKKYRFVIIALDIIEYLYNKMDEKEKEVYKKAYMLASTIRKMTIETAKKAGAIVLNYNCIQPFGQFISENAFYLKELARKSGRI